MTPDKETCLAQYEQSIVRDEIDRMISYINPKDGALMRRREFARLVKPGRNIDGADATNFIGDCEDMLEQSSHLTPPHVKFLDFVLRTRVKTDIHSFDVRRS
ncbi:hypothetical protein ABEG18_14650 [Alsobacter sp. KACC 23698]|uniref:Uncharacterized protein n=1 Tax=Alsobacter sp. KACC 23698 TaxID=3149229 RepID=A0AAU7J9D4_9HYPH